MKDILSILFGGIIFLVSIPVMNAQRADPVPIQTDEVRVVAVYPNPATEKLLVEFNAGEMGEEIQLRIKNTDGKTLLRRNLITFEGGNMVILPIAELPVGEYVVQLNEGRNSREASWQKM